MKIIPILLIIAIFSECKLRPDYGLVSKDAIHFAGIFISDNIQGDLDFRIKGNTDVINAVDSIYKVSGTVEGFSPMNYPVSVEHFTEFLHYIGGNPDEKKNWNCMEIYIGRKKLK